MTISLIYRHFILALYLFTKWSLSHIAKALGVMQVTVSRWIARFKETGIGFFLRKSEFDKMEKDQLKVSQGLEGLDQRRQEKMISLRGKPAGIVTGPANNMHVTSQEGSTPSPVASFGTGSGATDSGVATLSADTSSPKLLQMRG